MGTNGWKISKPHERWVRIETIFCLAFQTSRLMHKMRINLRIMPTYLFPTRFGIGTPPTKTNTCQDVGEFIDVRNDLVWTDSFWEDSLRVSGVGVIKKLLGKSRFGEMLYSKNGESYLLIMSEVGILGNLRYRNLCVMWESREFWKSQTCNHEDPANAINRIGHRDILNSTYISQHSQSLDVYPNRLLNIPISLNPKR